MNIRERFFDRTNSTALQFIRYIFVGGGATVIHWGLLVLFKEAFGLNANLANLIGFTGGLACNYLVSSVWVFDKKQASIQNKYGEFAAFAIIGVIGLGTNQGLIWLFDNPIAKADPLRDFFPVDKYYLLGQVAATGTAFFWNFFARKYLLYNKKAQ